MAKVGNKLYWKGVGSTALIETNPSDTNPTRYIFFNGERIARVDPGTTTAKYYVADNVGSTALETDYLGNTLNESLFFPYGVERVIAQSDLANNYKFTGKERDAETGLDDFGARYYDSNLGRFMTPDWDAKPTSVPYAKFGDPQTLNLYAYVENGPLNNVDADGHDSSGPDPVDSSLIKDGVCLTPRCIQLNGLGDVNGKTSADKVNEASTVAEVQQQVSQQATQRGAAPAQAQQNNAPVPGSATQVSSQNVGSQRDYTYQVNDQNGKPLVPANDADLTVTEHTVVVSHTGDPVNIHTTNDQKTGTARGQFGDTVGPREVIPGTTFNEHSRQTFKASYKGKSYKLSTVVHQHVQVQNGRLVHRDATVINP